MKGIKIEKGAVPSDTDNTGWRSTMSRMEVGDSFLAPAEKRNSIGNIAYTNFHAHTNKVFKSTVKGQPKGKVRFWREK